jgi:hypothetical protein
LPQQGTRVTGLWLLGLVAFLLASTWWRQVHAPEHSASAKPSRQAGPLPAPVDSPRETGASPGLDTITQPKSIVEERVCRCDVCGKPFVLIYDRAPYADQPGGTVICSTWVRCGSRSCRHLQPVLVPYSATSVHTREWLGPDTAAPSGRRTLREILLGTSEHGGNRPGD